MTGENRESPRVQAEFTVRAEALSRARLPGVDLSRGGLFIATERFLPLNAVLRLTIALDDAPGEIPTLCRVVFVRDRAAAKATGKPAGMGLELLDISAEHRAVLDESLAARSARNPAPPPPPRERQPSRSDALDVIVVDDDARFREYAAGPFRKRGDLVRVTSDGLEALAMCLKQAPDIIVSDVQMPRMDGWQLLRLVRARPSLAAVPVLFLTTLSGDDERMLGYQLGVDGYLAKPYAQEELLVRVHQIVRRARSARSTPGARTTLRGELDHVASGSLFSFLEMDRKSGVLLVLGASVARAFFRDGRVLRVELEGTALDSRGAFAEVLRWTTGQFEFSPQEVVCRDELGQSVTALLLESAREEDEGRR
ncbi:MAG: response regulator [Sorangiineae bacterium]|nr:response regulator [Polyangiaceae bacterium]MEB2322814.1 response regulator [Sorangiineae bacterium]